MKLSLRLMILAVLITGCANPLGGTSQSACPPSNEPLLATPAMAPGSGSTPGPFTYQILDQPPADPQGDVDVVEVDGKATRFQPDILLLSFDAEEVEMELPEGNIPGVLAHQSLVEPVLRDFSLEVVEQMRIPLNLQPITVGPGGSISTPPPVTHWKVMPSFRVRVIGAEAEPLMELQTDATVLGLRGTWVFPHRRTAGLFARYFRLLRRKDCYQLRSVGPNGLMSPG